MSDAAAPPRSPDEAARVRAAVGADTPSEILAALAADPAVTVRAAVATNPRTPGRAHTLLAADPDERVRGVLARKLLGLLPTLGHPEHDRLNVHVLDTLRALAADEAVRVRAAIADVVKDMPAVPHDLVLRLAHDAAMSVHAPVIRLSPVLTNDDLLSLLASPASPCTAISVAQRPGLQSPVCDAIAASADPAAIQALLANGSAAIREATLDALIARAADHEAWHDPLVRRPVLSARAAESLSEIVAAHLVGVLATRADLGPLAAKVLHRRLSERLRAPAAQIPDTPTLDQAMAEASVLYEEDQLTEDALLDAIARGHAPLAQAIVAVAAGVPGAVVGRAVTLRNGKGLVSLVWKAGFSMRAAVLMQAQVAHVAPAAILRPTRGDGFPLGQEEIRWQLDLMIRMAR